jgi:hypothetical protein
MQSFRAIYLLSVFLTWQLLIAYTHVNTNSSDENTVQQNFKNAISLVLIDFWNKNCSAYENWT